MGSRHAQTNTTRARCNFYSKPLLISETPSTITKTNGLRLFTHNGVCSKCIFCENNEHSTTLRRHVHITSLYNFTISILAAVSGGDNKLDRLIRIWDVEKNEQIAQLDHGSYKPITALSIHADYHDLLMSCDMDNTIKVWKWRTGKLMKVFKKMHGRIIYQIASGKSLPQ